MKKYPDPEPIYIKWVDSCNIALDRWTTLEDLDNYVEQTFCETLGFLVAENEHSLWVAGSLAPEEIGSVMQIPLVSIQERINLFLMHDNPPQLELVHD